MDAHAGLKRNALVIIAGLGLLGSTASHCEAQKRPWYYDNGGPWSPQYNGPQINPAPVTGYYES